MKHKRIMTIVLTVLLAVCTAMPQAFVFSADDTGAADTGTADPAAAGQTGQEDVQQVFAIAAGRHIKSASITDPENGQAVNSITAVPGEQVNITALAETGYHFWYYDVTGTTPVMDVKKSDQTVTVQGPAVLTAQAEANTYVIRYYKNGGKGKMKKQSMTYGEAARLTDNAFKREHYTFKGWNTKKNGKGKTYKNKAKVKDLTKEQGAAVKLYAQWEAIPKYTISYDLDGGTLDKKTGTVKFKYEKGTVIKLPKPEKKGYKFSYWEGSKYDAGAKYSVKGDHTFKAVWKSEKGSAGNKSGTGSTNAGSTNNNNSSNNNGARDRSANTGDDSNQTVPVLLLIISAATMAITFAGRKKTQ